MGPKQLRSATVVHLSSNLLEVPWLGINGFAGGQKFDRRRSLRRGGRRRRAQRLVEIGGQVDEVADRDRAVVIQVAFGPEIDGRVEVGSQIDEVRDGDAAIAIQITLEE